MEEENDLIFGRNNILEALKSERTIDKIIVSAESKDGSIIKICAIARERKIPIVKVSPQALNAKFPNENAQGICAYVSAVDYVEISDILQIAADRNEKPFIIIADEIVDPHNLGAIIRSADAFGAHGVIIQKRRACGITGSVEKASGGAINHMAIAKVANLSSAIETLKKNNIWIYGSDMDAKSNFYDENCDCGVGLVIGSEGFGMSKLIKSKCDILIKIPMKGNVSCLNASVAAGIIIQEISKKRS